MSPSCRSISSKCTDRLSMRTGVPVFIRALLMPCRVMLSVKWRTAGSAILPPSTCRAPTCISPLRNVPAVMMMLFANISAPQIVRMPTASPFSTSSSSAVSCQMSRFSVRSSVSLHFLMNSSRSHCARGDHIAGPFERLSMRNCMVVASVTSPICPPSASISRTICPLAIPPTAGLHDICAILFMSMVTKRVCAPMFAAAVAASQPACPPPITSTSYLSLIIV